VNFGIFPMGQWTEQAGNTIPRRSPKTRKAKIKVGEELLAEDAVDLGLVTVAPDDLDWGDEIRMAIEERTSPFARRAHWNGSQPAFSGAETTDTKIFGRLFRLANWIFIRPNATGEQGALKLFGKGSKAKFDRERCVMNRIIRTAYRTTWASVRIARCSALWNTGSRNS